MAAERQPTYTGQDEDKGTAPRGNCEPAWPTRSQPAARRATASARRKTVPKTKENKGPSEKRKGQPPPIQRRRAPADAAARCASAPPRKPRTLANDSPTDAPTQGKQRPIRKTRQFNARRCNGGERPPTQKHAAQACFSEYVPRVWENGLHGSPNPRGTKATAKSARKRPSPAAVDSDHRFNSARVLQKRDPRPRESKATAKGVSQRPAIQRVSSSSSSWSSTRWSRLPKCRTF